MSARSEPAIAIFAPTPTESPQHRAGTLECGVRSEPPPAVRVALGVVALAVAAFGVVLALDPLRGPLATRVEGVLTTVPLIAAGVLCAARAIMRRDERGVWALFAAAVLVWAAGDLYYTVAFYSSDEAPFPSLADVGYIAYYPLAYAGLVGLLRARLPRVSPLVWVDGVIGALAAAALGAAVLYGAVLSVSEGPAATVAANLAYPLGDLVILSVVVGAFVATGRASMAAWGWVAAGLVVCALADGLYLAASAEGSYVHGAWFDMGWPASGLLIAVAAWRPPRAVTALPADGWRTIAVPIGFALVALAVLMVDHFEPTNLVALVLATASLLAILARLVLTFGENVRMLRASREEAMTDALTGLANRRRLSLDLERELSVSGTPRSLALAVFDLDGFKGYNDTFGHPAGDALLARLAGKLIAAVGDRGTVYRMGGDEFCLLAPVSPSGGIAIVDEAADALSEQGESFALGCSQGTVLIPSEADRSDEALRIADQRLYRHKFSRRGSPSRQTTDALVRALSERHPDLDLHVHGVGDLVEATARRLGLVEGEREHARLAGELHDVGKMAIPDAILAKPGPLSEEEWAFMRRHTVIGERILNAAPALIPVARLVRASHERLDGSGYPDGLAGEDIPLGARIVAVCDAFDAMVSNRPYRAAMDVESALRELRRCAGSQFDPKVVEALCAVVSDRATGEPTRDEPVVA